MNPYGQVYYHPAYPLPYGYDYYGNPIVYAVGPPQMPPQMPPPPAPSPSPSTSSSRSSVTIVALPGAPKEAPQQYFAKVCRLVHLVEQWQDANKTCAPDWQFPEHLIDPIGKEWMPVEEAFERFGEQFSEEEKATWSIAGAQRRYFLDVVDDVLKRLKSERDLAIQMMRGNLLD